MSSPIPKAHERHNTATVILLSREEPPRVLLLHHRKLGKWMAPGGHVEPFENPIATIIREAEEETGIDLSSYIGITTLDEYADRLPPPDYFFQERIPAHKDQPEHFHLDHIYCILVDYFTPRLETEGALEIGWFSHAQTDKLDMYSNVRQTLNEIFAQYTTQG